MIIQDEDKVEVVLCIKCKKMKPIMTEFKTKKNGLVTKQCIVCLEKRKIYMQSLPNLGLKKERKKGSGRPISKFYKNDEEKRFILNEKQKIYNKKYFEKPENREKARLKNIIRREKKREEIKKMKEKLILLGELDF